MSTIPIAASPTWTTPSGGAWAYRYDGTSARTAPIITADGRVILSATKDFNAIDQHLGEITCVDFISLNPLWVNVNAAGVQGTPCLVGDVLYAGCNTGTLWAISATDGATLWQFQADANIVTAPVSSEGLLFFATTAGTFYALNLDTRQPQWTPYVTAAAGHGEAIVTAAAVIGDLVVFGASTASTGTIYALHVADGSLAWSMSTPAAVRSDPATHGQLVFFGCDDGQLLAIDVAAGAVAWTDSASRAIVGAPACDDDYVYFGSLDGTFNGRALRDDVQPARWLVQVSTSVTTDIAIHEGAAYFGGQSGAGQSALFLLDLASAEAQSAKVLVDSLQAQVNVNRAIQSGHVAFLDTGQLGGTAYAVNVELSSYIDRVTFSSQLIPDDYVAAPETGQPMPAAAKFQMTVQLLDESRAPIPHARVTLWASQPVEGGITCNGIEYEVPVAEAEALEVVADGGGQLSITAPGAVGTSALFLRPAFFLPHLSLHVFPDQANLDKLSTVSGADLSPTATATQPAATSYDGQPIIKESYYGSLDDIASSMRNTIGRQQNATTQKLKTSTAATDAKRQLPAGEVPEWTVEIRPDAYTFSHGVSAQFPSFAAGADEGLSWGDFEDFVKNVVKGPEKVAKTEWKYVEDAAQVVVHCADKAYKFVVRTVEDAVDVLIAIVKEVVTAIEKFIEWLSWLFSWQDILEVQGQIAGRVNDRLNALRHWLTAEAAVEVKAALEAVKKDAAAAFGTTVNAVSGSTVGSVQNSSGSPSDLFHPKGHDYTVQTGWLPKKLIDHLTPDVVPSKKVDELAELTATYLATVGEIIVTEFAQLPAAIEDAAKNYANLFIEKGGFLAQPVSAILEVFEDLLIVGIDCVEAILDATFAYLADALGLIQQILNEPIEVKLLDDLYQLLTGHKLTILGFTTLAVAVPATLIAKAGITIDDLTATAMAGVGGSQWAADALNIANAVVYAGLSIVWTVQQAGDIPPGLQCFTGALNVLMSALSIGASYAMSQGHWQDWVFYGSQTLQSIPIFIDAAKDKAGQEEEWKSTSATIWGCLGIAYELQAALWAHYWPESYSDPDGLNCYNNLFGSLPMFAGWIEESVGAELAVLDTFVGYGASAGMSAYLAFQPVTGTERGVTTAGLTPRRRPAPLVFR